MTHEAWGKVRETLAKRLGKNNFTSWIEPLRWAGLTDGVARFEVPTTFFGDWVSRNYSDHILGLLNAEGHAAGRTEFVVPMNVPAVAVPAANTADKPARTSKPSPRHRSDDELPGATLDSRFTFDSFVVGKPNELAHAAARRVAEGGPVTFNPLFLYGGVGLGKTHLMHAIAHELQSRQPHLRVLYL